MSYLSYYLFRLNYNYLQKPLLLRMQYTTIVAQGQKNFSLRKTSAKSWTSFWSLFNFGEIFLLTRNFMVGCWEVKWVT